MRVSSPQPRQHPSVGLGRMSNLQMIAELCDIVQLQAKIIKAQSEALEQLGAEMMADEIAQAAERASRLCGDDG